MTKSDLTTLLLEWYKSEGRELPWRIKGGAHPDPYVILVSEFMLQQTTVKTVIPYFQRFMERFPTLETLAQASQEEVYLYWQGLGYYSRARSLHTTARKIINDFDGRIPHTRKEILKLKGIGPYTASSLLALAFNLPETVIDGNVIRVICRMYNLTVPAAEIMNLIQEKAEKLTSRDHPADYASAIMDLGAIICTPKKPQCLICPWQLQCQAKGLPNLEQIPFRQKLTKKTKHGAVYLIFNSQNEIFIRKKEGTGLLSGLYEFPWTDNQEALLFQNSSDTNLEVIHVFTHFKLTLKIYTLRREKIKDSGSFVSLSALNDYPFSTLMKKVYRKAQLLTKTLTSQTVPKL